MLQFMMVGPPLQNRFSVSIEKIYYLGNECENRILVSHTHWGQNIQLEEQKEPLQLALQLALQWLTMSSNNMKEL